MQIQKYSYLCRGKPKCKTDMKDTVLRDKAEYLLAMVDHFAEKNRLSVPQAYRYFKRYGGVCLIDEHYDIMHTLSFSDALESMTVYMKRQGGAVG